MHVICQTWASLHKTNRAENVNLLDSHALVNSSRSRFQTIINRLSSLKLSTSAGQERGETIRMYTRIGQRHLLKDLETDRREIKTLQMRSSTIQDRLWRGSSVKQRKTQQMDFPLHNVGKRRHFVIECAPRIDSTHHWQLRSEHKWWRLRPVLYILYLLSLWLQRSTTVNNNSYRACITRTGAGRNDRKPSNAGTIFGRACSITAKHKLKMPLDIQNPNSRSTSFAC